MNLVITEPNRDLTEPDGDISEPEKLDDQNFVLRILAHNIVKRWISPAPCKEIVMGRQSIDREKVIRLWETEAVRSKEINKTQFAYRIGISRRSLVRILREAINCGRLPDETMTKSDYKRPVKLPADPGSATGLVIAWS